MFAQPAVKAGLICDLHPLVKITILVSTAIFACFVSNLGLLSLFLAAVLLTARFSGLSFGRSGTIIKLYLLGMPMLLALFVLSFLWSAPTMAQGALTGLHQGALYALRFLILILVNTLVVTHTDPREMLSVLRALRFPEVFSCVIAHVINFMPRLAREMQAIVEAQTMRGMRWRRLWRPSSWLPLAVPMLLSTMRYSEQSAISLELRQGFANKSQPLPRLAPRDWCVMVLCVALAVFSLSQYDSRAIDLNNSNVNPVSASPFSGPGGQPTPTVLPGE